MVELSNRAKNLKPSPTLALAAKARELKAQGKDIISLTVGEPDWDTFESIKESAIQYIKSGQTKYAPSEGIPELRDIIAKKTSRELGVEYSSAQVCVTTGGKMVIFAALQMLVGPGDEVIIPSPYWVSYPDMTELADAKPVTVTCDKKDNFKLTPEKLKSVLNAKSKVLILNSPSNPTGLSYTAKELKALGDVIAKFPNLIVLSDDIYNRLTFSDDRLISSLKNANYNYPLADHLLHVCPNLKEQTLIVNGMSKTYSMTGWRLGWALGPKEIIKAMTDYLSQSVSCASPFTQAASAFALANCDEEVGAALVKLKARVKFAIAEFASSKKVSVINPGGAFYIWLDVNESMKQKNVTTDQWAAGLLEQKNVLVVPGQHFGLEGYVRLSVAIKEDRLKEAITRITTYA
jgi:aspartate aminotransferase